MFTEADLANWKVKIEEPVHTNYKGIEVYKLTTWVQGPVLLQALNILENFDLKSMGYDSARYIHTLYQAMNLSFADRDFYYGDPAFPPASPIQGLLSKDYARERAKLVKPDHNDPDIRPGDPYPFQGGTNPFANVLQNWHSRMPSEPADRRTSGVPRRWPSTTAASGSGRRVLRRPMRKAGLCRSRRAAAGRRQ